MTIRISVTGASRAEVASLLDSAISSGRHAAHHGPELIPGTTRWRLDLWLHSTDQPTNQPNDNPGTASASVPLRPARVLPTGQIVRAAVGALLLAAAAAAGFWLAGVTGAVVAVGILAAVAGLLSIAVEVHQQDTANLRRP